MKKRFKTSNFINFLIESKIYVDVDDFYRARNEWRKVFSEYEKVLKDEKYNLLKKRYNETGDFKLAQRESDEFLKSSLEEWIKLNPEPVWNRYEDLKMFSDGNIKKFSELKRILNLNRTGKWGKGPFDEDLGYINFDGKTLLAIKPKFEEEDPDSGEIYDEAIMIGVTLELLEIKSQYRGQGLADKKMKELIYALDSLQLNCFLNIIPQNDSTDLNRLVNFYSKWGFKVQRKIKTLTGERILIQW